jgi:hypothetical protein
MVDHCDGDGLNNRRSSNLRKATRGQNACNAKTRDDNTSGFKGVALHRASGKWQPRMLRRHTPKHAFRCMALLPGLDRHRHSGRVMSAHDPLERDNPYDARIG